MQLLTHWDPSASQTNIHQSHRPARPIGVRSGETCDAQAKAAAKRVIGDVREDGLAALIEELWFDGPKAEPSGKTLGSPWEAMEEQK